MSLSPRLKTLRKQNKMTQNDVAKAINVSRSTVSGYETKNRQPSHEKLNALAELFNVSIDYLLNSNDDDSESSFLINDRNLDQQVFTIYNCLSQPSKEEVLKYMQYLKYCEKK